MSAPNPWTVNPFALFYSSTVGIEAYSYPGAIIVASFYTLNKPEMQAARAAGALVLLYMDFIEIVQKPTDPLLVAFYQGANPWPVLVNGVLRVNWPGSVLADITVGSNWAKKVVSQSQFWLTSPLTDGLFDDVAGGRLYSLTTPTQAGADWDTWDQTEKDEWTAGCVDIVRQQDEFRRANCPTKIIVNNNVWTGNGTLGLTGQKHVNGCAIENHPADPTSGTWAYANTGFSGLWPRVVISISRDLPTTAQKWASAPGITHVAYQQSYTKPVPAPVVPCTKIDYSKAA